MKQLLIASALSMMLLSGAAIADDDDDDRDGRRWAQYDRDGDRRDDASRHRKAEHEYWKDRAKAQQAYEKDRRKAQHAYEKDRRKAWKELARSERRWDRGQAMPRQYMAAPYYVPDYRSIELDAPPRGYTWVRPDPRDDKYYLVQMATGLITQFLGR